jgi:hypothetical protein
LQTQRLREAGFDEVLRIMRGETARAEHPALEDGGIAEYCRPPKNGAGPAARDTPSAYLEILKPALGSLSGFSGLSHPGVDGGHANEVCILTGAPHLAETGLPHNRFFLMKRSFNALSVKAAAKTNLHLPCVVNPRKTSISGSLWALGPYTRLMIIFPPEAPGSFK